MDPTTLEVLRKPMETVREALGLDERSSNEIAALSGIPGSVIRSVRNGSVAQLKVDTWAHLVWWLACEGWLGESLRAGMPRYKKYRPRPREGADGERAAA